MKIDLHVHTTTLSPDSFMDADEAIQTAREIGLDGICFTEHDRAWPSSEIELLRRKHGFPVFRGVEVMVQGGIEMLVFGLDIDFTTLLQPADLRRMVTAANGFMVYAHPFRGLSEQAVSDSAAALEIVLGRAGIAGVDAVEGHNGRNRDIQNQLALEMAARCRLKTTGGSDAHRTGEIGACATVLQSQAGTDEELLRELKAGRFTSERFRARETWTWQEDTRTIERRWL